MSGRPGNPSLVKGGASLNPSGKDRGTIVSARSLALACRDAASDEEIAQWLLEIASGRWPDIRPAVKRANVTAETPIQVDMPPSPPDGPQRMAALKEFLLRRDGQPMQAVVLKADIEARARRIENASDAIEIEAFDPAVGAALEVALTRALGAANIVGAIDVDSTEVPDDDG